MIRSVKEMIETILAEDFNLKEKLEQDTVINILEVGTGTGQGTTKYLYDYFKNKDVKFQINSYEGGKEPFLEATKYWKDTENVKIHNKFFCNKGGIGRYVIPNITSDLTNSPILTREHYYNTYSNIEKNGQFEGNIDYIPDLVVIDSTRFCHAAIIAKCLEHCDKETVFVMEDDHGLFEEEKILCKYFNLLATKRYPGSLPDGVWNFISFTLKNDTDI